MRPATIRDIAIEQGADWEEEFVVSLDNDESAFDLTGWVPQAQVRRSPVSEDVLAEFDAEVLDASSGRLRLRVTAAQTAVLGVIGTLCYDVVIVSDQEVHRVFEGVVRFEPWTTQPD
jgi:hypothetical protein